MRTPRSSAAGCRSRTGPSGDPNLRAIAVVPGFILLTHDLLALEGCGAPRGQTDSSLLTPIWMMEKAISCRHLLCGRRMAPGSRGPQFRPGNCAMLSARHPTSAALLLKVGSSGKSTGPPRANRLLSLTIDPVSRQRLVRCFLQLVPGRGRQRRETGSNSPKPGGRTCSAAGRFTRRPHRTSSPRGWTRSRSHSGRDRPRAVRGPCQRARSRRTAPSVHWRRS